MFPNASTARTAIVCALPAVCDEEPVTTSFAAAAEPTFTAALVPAIDELTVSVAVTVCAPAVARARAPNVCAPASPAVNVKSPGSAACGSVDVRCAVPV